MNKLPSVIFVVGLVIIGVQARSQAQIVVDHSFGAGGALTATNGNFNIRAGLGRTVGSNLFQSFTEFNIQTGQTATFTGPSGVTNVISRVTGTTASGLDGTLRSTIPGADVYLINPNGVVFGPNAHLDVKGSFAASTANKVRLKDGGVYNASQPQSSKLTSAPPAAFGFLGSAPKAVIVNGSQLSVPTGKAVTLVGGPVSVRGGAKVSAPAGRINVVSAASTGEAVFDFSQPAAPVDTSALTTLGAIALTGGSSLDTSDGGTAVDVQGRGGGSIWVRAGTLSLDGSSLLSKVGGSADGRGIDIRVTGTLSLSNLAAIDAGTTAGGSGGDVNISAGTLSMTGENTDGLIHTRIVTQTTGGGSAGNLALSAANATLSDGAFLDTGTENAGAGGNLTVNVGGSLRLLLGGGHREHRAEGQYRTQRRPERHGP